MRSASEPFLIGTKGNPKYLAKNVRNLVVAPIREHSRKPDELRTEIERLFEGPRCELFAREKFPGWDAWGDEVGKYG